MLAVMFLLMFFSQWNESAIMDELAHIPAGYSYLTKQDMRLNPEHPPLAKDLAAFPLLFLNLTFPADAPAWRDDINGQWTTGGIFLYESGNNPDRILHWARFPMMLLALAFGWLFYRWVYGQYGAKVALLALFFFAFSPTILAHSRYVTTDLAAAFGFFIGIAAIVRFFPNPTFKRTVMTGCVLGVALLLKFSLFLLVPLYFLFGVVWVFLDRYDELFGLAPFRERIGKFIAAELVMAGKVALICFASILIIWPVYQFHVLHYPPARQAADTAFTLQSFGIRPIANAVIFMADKPLLRPIGQYLFGLLMVIQRAAGGNTAYFLGEVSSAGWWYYFPLLYLFKELAALHALSGIAIVFGMRNIYRAKEKSFRSAIEWFRDNFALTASMIFIAVYWIQSMQSSLNIGVRHIMPTLPFIYFLVSRQTIRWLHAQHLSSPRNVFEWIRMFYLRYIKAAPRYIVAAVLLAWGFIATMFAFPHYLSYFNEIVGGTDRGYIYAVDSNYDWGQDLNRLRDYTQENRYTQKSRIKRVAVDYFGGGSPRYTLGDIFEPWQSAKGAPGGLFAVSLTFLQNSRGKRAAGDFVRPEDSYSWLDGKTPVARAGKSIFIYDFSDK